MNLHGIVSNVISVVNPTIRVTWRSNVGYATNDDFSRTPSYVDTFVPAQVQHLQFDDLKQIEGMGIQGLRRKLYLFGNVTGMVRTMAKGDDQIVLPDGSTWLVAMVLETYGHGIAGQTGWCSVVITLQNTPGVPLPITLLRINPALLVTWVI